MSEWDRREREREGVHPQHGSILPAYVQDPPTPLMGTEAMAGNLKPMMSSSESTGYRHSVRKCTKPKVNITQLPGLIVFTVAQLRRIKGFPIKYGTCVMRGVESSLGTPVTLTRIPH